MVKRYHVDFECVPYERLGGELGPANFDGHIFINSDDGEDFPPNEPADKPTDVVLASDYDALETAVLKLFTNPCIDIGDQVYAVREREGQGWDGPAVKAWSDVVVEIKRLLDIPTPPTPEWLTRFKESQS